LGIVSIRAFKRHNIRGFINSLFSGIVLTLSIFAYIYISTIYGHFILVYPLDLILIGHFLLMLLIQLIYYYRAKKSQEDTQPKINEYKSSKDFTLDQELDRKAVHLLGFLLIPPYFGFGLLYYYILAFLLNLFNIPPMNIQPSLIPQTMALLGIITALIFVMVPEFYRMYNIKFCLLQRYMHILRKDEVDAIGPHVNTIIGVIIPIILISEPYLAVGTMFSGIMADSVASIVGKKWGRIIFNNRNRKTIEGLIGGTLSCFVLSYIFYIFNYSLNTSLILSTICCTIFALIDIASIYISDNILYPVISGISISIVRTFFI